jgi:hypothetical protein
MNSRIRENRYSGLRHHAKVHSFRIFTVILAWVFIAAAFYEKPELHTGIQRAIQSGTEIVGDNIPPPWGPRIEFVFREIGGFIWLQWLYLASVALSGFSGFIWLQCLSACSLVHPIVDPGYNFGPRNRGR